MAQANYLEETLRLQYAVEKTVATSAKLAKRLDFAVLGMSVLTSGSLWLLLSEKLPKSMLWFGAITSSLTTLA